MKAVKERRGGLVRIRQGIGVTGGGRKVLMKTHTIGEAQGGGEKEGKGQEGVGEDIKKAEVESEEARLGLGKKCVREKE